MRIISCRYFILLSIFHCANVLALVANIDKRNNDLSRGSLTVKDRLVKLKELSTKEKTTSTKVEASKKSLANSSFSFLASSVIKSRNGRSARNRRDSVTDDGAAIDSSISDDRTADEDGESTREKIFLSSSIETTRHAKHRRRHRCKNRSSCSRSAYQNANNESDNETRIIKPLEEHPIFQEQESRNDRNLERQLLVGNRSLALFRQELAAAAAAATAAATAAAEETGTTSRKIGVRLIDDSSREIDDILADARSRHGQDVTKISSKEKVKENVARNVEQKKNESSWELTSKINSSKNKSDGLNNSSIEKENGRKNFTGRNESCKNEFENETDLDCLREKLKEETRITLESDESSDEELLDTTIFASIYMPLDDRTVIHESLVALLSRLFNTLKNSTSIAESREILRNLNERNSLSSIEQNENDRCQKWLDSKEKLEEAFLGPLVYLPACPCQYPSSIFYDDKIWDEGQKKYFRWRDVSGETERLDVYKPGATYCVRSLLAQGSDHAAAQHCCYDRHRRLLTRGSGAGTPNFVSPEISSKLHERIDILPWRLCKGDFTRSLIFQPEEENDGLRRTIQQFAVLILCPKSPLFGRILVPKFNRVRTPNNDNRCKINPDDDEYRRQIENTKYY